MLNAFFESERRLSRKQVRIERAFRTALQPQHLPLFLLRALWQIEPTRWSGNKAKGIDLDSNFYWIDDDPSRKAVAELTGRGLIDRLVTVELGLPSSLELTGARHRI